MSKKTKLYVRAYSMDVTEVVSNKHLTLSEADAWVKKNIIETSNIIKIEHISDGLVAFTLINEDYKNPENNHFRMDVEQYKTNKL